MRHRAQIVAALSCLSVVLSALAWSSTAEAAREAKGYAISNWNASCSGATRSSWDDMVRAWHDEITRKGFSAFGHCWFGHCSDAYIDRGVETNGSIRNRMFADRSEVSWGRDGRDLDNYEAVMVAWHGWESGDEYRGTMRTNGSDGENCTLQRSEMNVGDAETEYLHISSCNSMDDNQWGAWVSTYDGVRQIDGFHGIMWIFSWLTDEYDDFAEDAIDGAIGPAWIQNLYVRNIRNNFDQCPVAHTVGSSGERALRRLAEDSYSDRFPKPADDANWWAVRYIEGCDPQNEGEL